MTIRQFRYFLKIAHCGSINKAAQQLDITQQSLLASMNSLEKSLGFSVFSRSKSGVSLTPQGEAILDDVQRIVDICAGWTQFMDVASAVRRSIRIAGTSSMINLILGKAVLSLKEKYPSVAIELHERKKDELMHMVMEDSMIGLCGALPPEELEHRRLVLEKGGMRVEVMGADDYAVIVNSRHPLASRGVLRTEELGQFTAALYPNDDRAFFYSGIYQYFSRQHAPYYGSKQESLLNLILRDDTVAAVFPVSVARNPNIPEGCLKGLFVEDYPMPGLNCLVYPREDRLSPVEKAIMESFRDVYRQESL